MKVLVINCGSSSLKYQVLDMTNEELICKGLVERIQNKTNKKHIEIILLDKAELIIEAGHNAQKQFAKNVLSGLTEEKQVCINIFDKICNNAEEH